LRIGLKILGREWKGGGKGYGVDSEDTMRAWHIDYHAQKGQPVYKLRIFRRFGSEQGYLETVFLT